MSNVYVYVLTEARKLIESDEEEYVCLALEEMKLRFVMGDLNSDNYLRYEVLRACEDIRRDITNAIYPHQVVTNWLIETLFKGTKHWNDVTNEAKKADDRAFSVVYDNIKEYRLRWIDQMIEMYSDD
ncbi:hypothetical protein [Ralstonia phage RSP15]|uniref:hypothetical protein n=1 Tax=Ralstonia phage RSP15 TaxID=1785960 RepID=UPI00074D2FEA|nr:hypothetical protein BH754_gp187 [Ralstonia phage RSP15]BAU40119.1 hypothetical protein [Ralstonia phage RSP15]